ncbi:serine hydrolase domain-containing protein [Flavisolibacter tropicus]|nr:serine hydrolase domain-containing protein [Flavisolibacter tropicus]
MREMQPAHNVAVTIHRSSLLMMIKCKTLLILLMALTLCTAAYAQPLDKAKLDQFFDRLSEKDKAMGSLFISKDANVQYTRSIGYSQINGIDKKPATAATKYRIGSVTKMFTAALIFQLAEEGRLKLTDHLDKFYPQIPNSNKITIANILAHRSGIHDVSEDQDVRTHRTSGISKEDMMTFIAKSKADFEPDTKYAYSNSGYFILGSIVEKVTGKSYNEAFKKQIASKIGLKDTYMGTGNIDANHNESFSYRYSRDWEQLPITHNSILFGSGAMISTPADQAKFIQALFNEKIVSKASLAQMMQNQLGMTTFTYNGKTFYGHTGGIDNFGSWLVYQPEEKLVVSYATNAKVYPVSNIIDGVFDIYYNKPFTIPSFESIAISTEELEKYVGVYSSAGAPVKFTVTRDGTKLFVQLTNQSAIPLVPTAPDRFKIESAPVEFLFDTAKKEMTVIRNGREKVFTKEG